jgi:SAM-dependent methyltransferase/methyltransferase-like protein
MNKLVEKLQTDYDSVAYESWPYPQAHPDRIGVVAALQGLTFVPVENCRVLEVGCASGGHLIPMADQIPGSRFVGIELSGRQFEAGSKLVRELGLRNIELRCGDLMDFPADSGEFDYIIAHGFYSWVPLPVRLKLLEICRRHLSPHGLAYISYNTYPGWRIKEIARNMMLYHARNATDLTERAALGREIIEFVAGQTPDTGPYGEMMRGFGKAMSAYSDSHILHDQMEAVNEPVNFQHFMNEASANGLAYVGESSVWPHAWARLPGQLRETVLKMSKDRIEQEQHLDFLLNRAFRESILCRKEAGNIAAVATNELFSRLYIAGNPREEAVGTDAQGRTLFQLSAGEQTARISDPRAIAAIRHLRGCWPSAVPFSELVDIAVAESSPSQSNHREKTAMALAGAIQTCYALRILEIWNRPTDHSAGVVGEFPIAPRLARWQAKRLPAVTSLRQKSVKVTEEIRAVLPLLDGTRNRKALAAETGEGQELVDSTLRLLASASLLMKN